MPCVRMASNLYYCFFSISLQHYFLMYNFVCILYIYIYLYIYIFFFFFFLGGGGGGGGRQVWEEDK